MKYKNNILFFHNKVEHFLFQVINFGKETDELKFNFNDPKTITHLIHNRNTGIFDTSDIINKYGELTYHSDGSFMFKFPNYPLKNKIYFNPSGVGNRRKPLCEIKNWEPLFHYEVYKYDACKKSKDINPKEKFILQNDRFFNGTSFGCVVCLVHKMHTTFPIHNQNESIYVRIEHVTETLDIGIALGKLKVNGRIFYMPELRRNIFVDNNYLRIVEKKDPI